MIHVNILVEGQTEEMFVKELLAPYLWKFEISINPIIISTKRLREGGKFKGGLSNSNFDTFINDLKKLIQSTPQGFVTTFIDYYHLPSKFPGYDERLNKGSKIEKVLFLEQKLTEYIGNPANFIPYIQLHEFEAFHFSDKIGFANFLSPKEANLKNLFQIIESYNNPEDINEGATTAPSKRILTNYTSYDKVTEGNLILMEIGLETIMNKCIHFKTLVDQLTNLTSKTA